MQLSQQIKKSVFMGAIICTLVMLMTACNGEKKMKEDVTKYFEEYMSSDNPEITGWTINSITFDTIGTFQYYYEVGERYRNGRFGDKHQKEKLSEALNALDRINPDKELQIVANLDVHYQEEWYDPMTYYVGIRDGKCVSCSYSYDDNLKTLCSYYEFVIFSTVEDIVRDQYYIKTKQRLERNGITDPVDQMSWMLRYGKGGEDFYIGFVRHDLRAFFE